MNPEFLEEIGNREEVNGSELVAKHKCDFCVSCSYKCFLFNLPTFQFGKIICYSYIE